MKKNEETTLNVIEREINGTTYRATFENVDFGAKLISLETRKWNPGELCLVAHTTDNGKIRYKEEFVGGGFYFENILYLLESDLRYFWRTDFEKDFERCLSKLLKIRDLREELEYILYSLKFD